MFCTFDPFTPEAFILGPIYDLVDRVGKRQLENTVGV